MTPDVLQVGVALTLLVAAGGKLVAPGELAAALRSSRTVPRRSAGPLASVVVSVEVALATAVLALGEGPLSVAFLGVALLALGFSAWSGSVLARGITLRCSCFGGASRNVTSWTLLRALGLCAAGVLGALSARAATPLLEAGPLSFLSSVGLVVCVLLLTAFFRTRSHLVLSSTSMESLRSLSNEVRT